VSGCACRRAHSREKDTSVMLKGFTSIRRPALIEIKAGPSIGHSLT
jgi:hypothetical protein